MTKNHFASSILFSRLKHHKARIAFFMLLSMFLLSSTAQTFAQGINITGTVSDQGATIPGVTIIVKGTTKGTVTDLNGKYSIEVPNKDAILVFSFLGYKTHEFKVGNQTVIDIVLEDDTKQIEEVVVVGYGTLEKRSLTTSVSSIKGSNMLQGMGGATVATALQGKVSGLTINGNSSPNSGNDFQLRGVASVNASKSPLVVIDGIPGGDFRSLNQEDIESIDVLKDASAGAIYGTRAAGGVILVTTKKAQSGPVQIIYNGELSTETVRRRPEMLSPEEFVANGLGQDYGYKTDWYGLLVNEGDLSQRHSVSIAGGADAAKIYTTFSYSDQKGIAIGDSRKDYAGRMNANFKALENRLEISTHGEFRIADRDIRSRNNPDDANEFQMFNMAMKLNPTQTAFDNTKSHGYNVWTGGWEYYNPLADIMLKQKNGKDKWLLADATFKLNLTHALSTQATVGYQWKEYQQYYYVSSQHKESLDNSRSGEAQHKFSKDDDVIFDWLVNYNNTFGDHDIRAVGGYSFQEFNGESFDMKNFNFPVDGVGPWDMGSGTYLSDGRAEMGSHKDVRERLIAFFARANYSYKDKYLLAASVRREGSSKFGSNNKWGTFPSISAAWRISKEPFIREIEFIDDLKIRGGYGVTGNNGFDSGKSTRMYSKDTWWLSNGTWLYTYGSKHNVNNDLVWEESKEINLGLDYSLFNNRLYGKLDVFSKKVDGMLYDISVAVPPSVHDKTTMNMGSLKTKGWEFEVGAALVKTRDWNYNTTFRFSHSTTKLISLWGSQTYQNRVGFPAPGSPGDAGRLEPGCTIGQYWLWRFAGFTDDGQWMLYDKDGNAFDVTKRTKTLEDKAMVGNAIPKLIIAWENSVSYKNFDLNIYLRSWIGHDVFNTIDMYYGLPTVKEQNVLASAFEKNKNVKGEKELCDYWLEDGTFLKIDAINLGYSLNLSKVNNYVKKVRLYTTIRDVACFTKYSGLNPEVDINGLDPGYEWFRKSYPQTTRYTLGVQVTF